MRFAPRTLGQVSRYSLPCSKKGNGENDYFLHDCARKERERERVTRQCVSMCASVHYGPHFLLSEFPAVFSCNPYIFLFFRLIKTKNDRVFCFRSQRVFCFNPLTPPPLVFFRDPYDFKNLFFLPSQVMRAFQRGAVAQQFCKLIARNAWDVCV